MAVANLSGVPRLGNFWSGVSSRRGAKTRLQNVALDSTELNDVLDSLEEGEKPTDFLLPRGVHPKAFVEAHFGAGAEGPRMQFLKGTTTLAFLYEPKTEADRGGIVVAVDSRATSGQYIMSKSVMKVLEISDNMVATMAGGAADCQFWIRILAKQCALYELQNNEQMTVAKASKWLSNLLFNYRGMGISMGSMVAGYDKTGPQLYYVDSEGLRVKGERFSVGSGMMAAMGVMDSFREAKMTDADAVDLARKAIMHATYRDAGSGGTCNVYHITPPGKQTYVGSTDVSQMYYDFMKEMKREPYEP